MTVSGNWEADHVKDGRRLLAAFGKIEKSKRKKVVALAESMANAKG